MPRAEYDAWSGNFGETGFFGWDPVGKARQGISSLLGGGPTPDEYIQGQMGRSNKLWDDWWDNSSVGDYMQRYNPAMQSRGKNLKNLFGGLTESLDAFGGSVEKTWRQGVQGFGQDVKDLFGSRGGGAYTGSAAQNSQLMSAMREAGSEGTSIVDALKSAGADSSFGARGEMWSEMFGGGTGFLEGIGEKAVGALGGIGKTAMGALGKAGSLLKAGAPMLKTAAPYLAIGQEIISRIGDRNQAFRQRDFIDKQMGQLESAQKSLEDVYGRKSDIYQEQFGEQLGQASYGAGQSLLDIMDTGESVGHTGLSYSGTVGKRLERARAGVRKQFGFSKTGLENVLGEKLMGLEEWKAGQEASIASEMERLKYERKEAVSGTTWNPFD